MELIGTLHKDRIVEAGLQSSFETQLPQHFATRYLHHMFASKPFQQALINYQELLEIQHSLNQWEIDLPALQLMLNERRNSFESKRPLVEQTTDFNRLDEMKQQRNSLAEEVNRIKDSEDVLALANEDEVNYLEQLDDVKSLLNKLQDQRDLSEENEKYRLLSGLLYWDISTDFPRRYWQVLHQLQLLDRALKKAETSAASLQQASSINVVKLNDFDQRISGQDSDIQRLVITTSRLIDEQQQLINNLAIQVIQQRKQHLLQLRLNARYSLTRLYDEITQQGSAQ